MDIEQITLPYTIDNPPAAIKNLPKGAQRIWINTFNAVYADTRDEDKARQAAWANVKKKYKKGKDGKWVKKKNSRSEEMAVNTDLANIDSQEDVGEKDSAQEEDFLSNECLVQFSFPIELDMFQRPLSEVQLAREGSFQYRRFIFTDLIKFDRRVFETMVENFNRNVWGSELAVGLPFDVEHLEYLGAFGWIKSMHIKETENGLGLFAYVDWTDTGRQFIQEGRFKYTSLSYYKAYQPPEGGEIYNFVVSGAALTTKPFLTGMEPVSLSKFRQMFNSDYQMSKEVKINMDEIKNAIDQIQKALSANSEILKNYGEKIEELSTPNEPEPEKEFEMEVAELKVPDITGEVKKVSLALQNQIDQLTKDNRELQKMNAEVKAREVVDGWYSKNDEKVSMKFKPDQRENVQNYLSALMYIDKGLTTFSEATAGMGKGLSEIFVEIINGMPAMDVDLSEKGHSEVEPEPVKMSKDDETNMAVEKYMKDNNIKNFVEASTAMMSEGLLK